MLSTQNRALMLDSFRPPDGYALDRAIGTTFSLDLLSLLTLPLAFTFFAWEDEEGRPTADPLALLQAIRRHAGRMSVFCQAGQIDIPRTHRQLYAYLEEAVVEVKAPSAKGVFHPKVWILRFTAASEPVHYRLLCLTRNLTFDQSWDTVLALDGELADRTRGFGANRGLGDFIASLPSLGLRSPSDRIVSDVELVQDEIRRVRFEPPEGFSDIAFWPLGLPNGRGWPFDTRIDRLLIVSPFVSPGCLSRLTSKGNGHVLVAPLDALGSLKPASLRGFERVFALNPNAAPEQAGDLEGRDPAPRSATGLHAKLFVADAGREASVWTGSANATNSAFGANVEFLVQLSGEKSVMGVDAVLGQPDERGGLQELLVPFEPEAEPPPGDAELETLRAQVESARRELANMGLVARVGAGGKTNEFDLRVFADERIKPKQLPQTTVRCWPISMSEDVAAIPVTSWVGEVACFSVVSLEALTSFFAFEIVAEQGARRFPARFVLNLPLEGAPPERREEILRSLLSNREQVLRFLLMLLMGEGMPVMQDLEPGGDVDRGCGRLLGLESTIFEALMRALDRDPARLDQVAAVVEDLRRSSNGDSLLPDGFDRLWGPIWEARQGIPS